MDIQETLKALYNELEEKAIEPQYYRYYIKDANQIIRKHFESYASQQMPSNTSEKIKEIEEEIRIFERPSVDNSLWMLNILKSLQQENQTED